MRKQHPLFIYDGREVITLSLMAFVGGSFLFTAGLHYGKRLGMRPVIEIQPGEGKAYPGVVDKVPNRQELFEQGRVSTEAAEKILGDILREQVLRNGVKLDRERQTELPGETASKTAGATTLDRKSKKVVSPKSSQTNPPHQEAEELQR
jgi:hypothetical protein